MLGLLRAAYKQRETMSLKRTYSVPNTISWSWPIFALLVLSSCASDPEVRVVTKTETVEVPVEVYRPLPDNLTRPTPYPPSLPERFTEEDKTDLIFALYDALDQANVDKAKAGQLTQPQTDSQAAGAPRSRSGPDPHGPGTGQP